MIIPNLPVDKMVEEDGKPTGVELLFRQNLIQALQQGAGPEGLVAPSQTAANIAIIVANTDAQGRFTCQPGTLLYDTTNDLVKVAVLVAGVPTFKTITVT